MTIEAYKGFNKDMTCRGFQYEEGKTYEEETASLCKNGFHACKNPLDCYIYYKPSNSVFRRVTLDDVTAEKSDDSKLCGKKITIGAEIDVAGICKAHFDYVRERTTNSDIGKDNANLAAQNRSSLAAQNRSSLAAKDWSSLAAKNWSSLAAKDWSSLAAQDGSSLAAKDWSSLAAKDWSSLAAKNWSSLAAQNRSSLAAQNRSSLAAKNWSSLAAQDGSSLAAQDGSSLAARDWSSLAAQDGSSLAAGKNSVIAAFNSNAKGDLGTLIALAVRDDEGNIIDFAAGIVDGKKIKVNTWYAVKDGAFMEAEETEATNDQP